MHYTVRALTMCGDIFMYMYIVSAVHALSYICFAPLLNLSGRTLITVSMVQSTNVIITINGTGEMYSCTINNKKVNITEGQPVQWTGLAPNTTYTLNCHSVVDSCLEANTAFTTGMLAK